MRGKENAAAQRPWKLLAEPVRADFSAPMGARPPDSVAGVGRPACLCAVLRSSVVDGVQATRNRGRSGGSGRRARERTQQLRAFPAGMKSLDPSRHSAHRGRKPQGGRVREYPCPSVRLRTTAAKLFKRVESATALIWKLLLVAEKRFRRLDAPHLLKGVFEGRKFEDGKPVSAHQRKAAA